MAEGTWPVLVEVSPQRWLTCAPPPDDGVVWLSGPDGPYGQIDPAHAISCLPLLERGYGDVRKECDRAAATRGRAAREAMDRLVPWGVLDASLEIGTDYWLRLACAWVAELGPSDASESWLDQVETRAAASQWTGHEVRRIRHRWSASEV